MNKYIPILLSTISIISILAGIVIPTVYVVLGGTSLKILYLILLTIIGAITFSLINP